MLNGFIDCSENCCSKEKKKRITTYTEQRRFFSITLLSETREEKNLVCSAAVIVRDIFYKLIQYIGMPWNLLRNFDASILKIMYL